MSAFMSNNNVQNQQGFSVSMKIDEESVLMQMQSPKQGIVTILGCEAEPNLNSGSSLRRTLSADMSSKKWLSQNSSSVSMKKIGSSEELFQPKTVADSSSSEEEDDDESKELEAERLQIWSSIQRNKKEEQEKSGAALDTWSSIISLKGKEENEISKSLSLPATPYVHPLVKRSKSSLSEKSLEICTESLGSETGSDGLLFSPSPSSSPTSETRETEETEEETEKQKLVEQEEELEIPRQSYTKKSPPRSFPPPLPSLSRQTGVNSSVHMRSRRDNGRLVLEAVSVPSLNNFSVQREDGRLVLTFAEKEEQEENDGGAEEEEEEDEYFGGGFEFDGEEYQQEEKEQNEDDGEEEEEETEESEESVMEESPLMSSGVASVQSLTLMMNNDKQIGLVNKNPKWCSKEFNEVDVNVVEVEVETSQIAKSLPPRVTRLIPSSPSSFNFNAYEYYWRSNPSSKSPKPNINNNNPFENHQVMNNNGNNNNKLIVSNEQQQLLVLRGKNGDYLVHNLKSCKDSRRSFLFWEPYCIATS